MFHEAVKRRLIRVGISLATLVVLIAAGASAPLASQSPPWEGIVSVASLANGDVSFAVDIMFEDVSADSSFGIACDGADSVWFEVRPPAGDAETTLLDSQDRPCTTPYLHFEVFGDYDLPPNRPVPFTATVHVLRDGLSRQQAERIWVELRDGQVHRLSPEELVQSLSVARTTPGADAKHANLEVGDLPGEAVLAPFESDGRCAGDVRCVSRSRNSWRAQ